MTLSQTSKRLGAFAAAVVTSAVLVFSAPQAHAQTARYYTVELAQPAVSNKAVVRGVVFQCNGTVCRAPLTSSAPRNVCASVAREFGEVTSFKAGDRVLDVSDLDGCNAKKKVIIAKD
ncbi:MAG: CC_3452 family protein [Sphingorhabdus sp.]